MYFDDLTPYSYCLTKSLPAVLNVGWLDHSRSFRRGQAPDNFIKALKRWLSKAKANQTRGFELCRFCRMNNYQQMHVVVEERNVMLGSAEIWVPGIKGEVYASPTIIVHYVEEHEYLPPDQYIDAVLRPVPTDWNAAAVAERMIEESLSSP